MKSVLASFVEVINEPLHIQVLDNSFLRIYRTVINPGENTEFHRHSRNTLYIVSKGGDIQTELMMKNPSCPTILPKGLKLRDKVKLAAQKVFCDFITLPQGFLFYMPSYHYPVIHRACSSMHNGDAMELVGVEFKDPETMKSLKNPHDLSRTELKLKNALVTRLFLKADQDLSHFSNERPCLIMSLSGFIGVHYNGLSIYIHPGEFHWFDSGSINKIVNIGSMTNHLIIIHV